MHIVDFFLYNHINNVKCTLSARALMESVPNLSRKHYLIPSARGAIGPALCLRICVLPVIIQALHGTEVIERIM